MIDRKTLLAVGLMSGTSADGIDAALVSVDRIPRTLSLRHYRETPFSAQLRGRILAAAHGNASTRDLCLLDADLGEAFAEAVIGLCGEAGVAVRDVDVIGSHGQTVWHEPGAYATLQLGKAVVIAARTGVPVVSDFRTADMAQGGQGAPLAPTMHHLLFAHPSTDRAVVNIGGVANFTWLAAGQGPEAVVASDTGPGNMVVDWLVARLTGGEEQMDRDGVRASQGRVHEPLLGELLEHPFFAASPPKSTGREVFGSGYAADLAARADGLRLGADDLVATATALTARTIARAVLAVGKPGEVLLCGGGARNPALKAMLKADFNGTRIGTVEEWGVCAHSLEAVAVAELACRNLWGEPGNLPAVTGARNAVVLGSVTPAGNGWVR